MCNSEKTEKLIFQISLWSGIGFVILEFLMAVLTSSQAILMDAAFDAAELVVIILSLILTPLLYQPISEKRPFGYYQCESLFMLIKGFMMISVTFSLIASNVQVMLAGGNHVNSTLVSVFEMILSLLSLAVLLILRHHAAKVSSPLVEAELYGWKIDLVCGFCVSLAFLAPPFLASTPLSWLVPYFDQVAAIVLAAFILPGPARLIVASFKNLLLFSPDSAVADSIRSTVARVLAAHAFCPVFVDITQTGRKIWVAVSFHAPEDAISLHEVRRAYDEIVAEVAAQHENVDLELIPTWESAPAQNV